MIIAIDYVSDKKPKVNTIIISVKSREVVLYLLLAV